MYYPGQRWVWARHRFPGPFARVLNENNTGQRRWLTAYWDPERQKWCRPYNRYPIERLIDVDVQSLDDMN